jgi:hypothetical protein
VGVGARGSHPGFLAQGQPELDPLGAEQLPHCRTRKTHCGTLFETTRISPVRWRGGPDFRHCHFGRCWRNGSRPSPPSRALRQRTQRELWWRWRWVGLQLWTDVAQTVASAPCQPPRLARRTELEPGTTFRGCAGVAAL